MEHVNNDMDDLFRKAGEQYPLKTSGSDWDGVLGKLREDNGSMTNDETGNSNRRRWGWLFLLIPLTLGSVIYFSSGHKKSNQISAGNTNNNVLLKKDAVTVKSNESNIKAGVEKSVPQKTNASENIDMSADQKSNTGLSLNRVQSEKNARAGKSTGSTLNSGAAASHKPSANGSAGMSDHVKLNAAAGATAGTTVRHPDGNQSGLSNTEGITQSSTPSAETAAAGTVALAAAAPPASAGSADAGQKNKISSADSLSAKAKDSATNTAAVKKAKPTAVAPKGFYFGLIAGPDWSSVKMQSVNQTGYSLGVLAGYRFNKRISLESGIYWDKKYYYSTGEYFSTKHLPVQYPPALPNKSVEGYCNMFEIPVNIRYDFATRVNHGFFAKTGFSTYIMKKEEYSFTKTNDTVKGPYPYYNTTTDFIAILQLSGGYERTIGQKTKIRVEPYVKIPLQGIGIGSMPISSAGIYFGITYSLK
jgi:hypothetical protein